MTETQKKPTKKAILEALHERLGRCVALTEKGTECTHWAVDLVGAAAYCGQHISGIYTREAEARASAERKAKMNASIDAYLAATGQAAHACGPVCYWSHAIQGPRDTSGERPTAT